MKLVSFGDMGKERPGVLYDNDTILCLGMASNGEIRSIRGLLDQGEAGLDKVRNYIAAGPKDEWIQSINNVRIGPPINNPTKIVGMGLNYISHTAEQSVRSPKRPLIFSKSVTSLAGDKDPLWYPIDEKNFDYETELALVFGKTAFRVNTQDWEEYVAGYTLLNDVSGRDAQFADRKWFRGKSYDSTCPLGPYLVTKDEIVDPHDLKITATLNGETRQDAHTSDLIYKIPEIIEFATRNITFHPGDIIATGTPGGVGIFLDPPRCMEIGDEIVCYLEKVGTLTNKVHERSEIIPSVYPARII